MVLHRRSLIALLAAALLAGCASAPVAPPPPIVFVHGNGDTAACHHPAYNFDDSAIPVGTSYLAKIVETAMPA